MRVSGSLRMTALLLTLAGCASFPLFSRQAAPASGSHDGPTAATRGDFTQATMELQNISFDGERLSGRLLISPTRASLRIDKRILETADLEVESVSDCSTGASLSYVIMDVLAPPLRESDVLMLTHGSWYGKEIHLSLFAEHATHQPLPSCFEADLVYHALDIKDAARLHVRVERHLPASSWDAGMP